MISVVRSAALSPASTGLLLFALSLGPASLREAITRRISNGTLERIITVLKGLFALGLLGSVNRRLSEYALNQFRWTTTPAEKWNWNKEIAVVTGGSGGIGALMVKKLAFKGVKVIVLDIAPLPKGLQGFANIKFHQCDITDHHAVKDVAETIKSSYGSPSLLLNNAGVALPRTVLDQSPENLRKVMDINLISQWYTIQAFVPDMIKKKKGHVISTASMASFAGVPILGDYCASKAGLVALMETLRVELRDTAPEIRLSTIHPIFVNTPLINPYRDALTRSKALVVEPEEVAEAAIKQILSGKSGQICIPETMGLGAALLRGLPHWVQEGVRGARKARPD